MRHFSGLLHDQSAPGQAGQVTTFIGPIISDHEAVFRGWGGGGGGAKGVVTPPPPPPPSPPPGPGQIYRGLQVGWHKFVTRICTYAIQNFTKSVNFRRKIMPTNLQTSVVIPLQDLNQICYNHDSTKQIEVTLQKSKYTDRIGIVRRQVPPPPTPHADVVFSSYSLTHPSRMQRVFELNLSRCKQTLHRPPTS